MNTNPKVIVGDVLNSTTQAILLTIDGAKRGMEGNIARQFGKRYPEDWEYLQRDIKYPIPLGCSIAVPWEGDCPWGYFIVSSTLHHADILDQKQKLAVIRSALSEALALCARFGIRSMATPVLQGGWRLDASEALGEMRRTVQLSPYRNVQVEIHVQSPSIDSVSGDSRVH